MIRAAVLGWDGVRSAALLRLLEGHPVIAGPPPVWVSAPPPGAVEERALPEEARVAADPLAALLEDDPHLVLAITDGSAAGARLGARQRVIDLSGEELVRSAAEGSCESSERIGAAFELGLPEAHRWAIQRASRIAVPGWIETAALLACLPPAREGLVRGGRIAVVPAPASGAHLRDSTPERRGRVAAVIAGALDRRGGRSVVVDVGEVRRVDAPESHVGVMLRLARVCRREDVAAVYRRAYERHPLVRAESSVETSEADGPSVLETSATRLRWTLADDGFHLEARVVCDALLRDGVGQAVQCLNLMFGLRETSGLLDNAGGADGAEGAGEDAPAGAEEE